MTLAVGSPVAAAAPPVMYLAHFGLREAPFAITPDPRYLYMSERHREALAHLLYGVGEGGGFVQLTGEVGTGKTTVCRCFLEQLPVHVDVALILNPRLTSLELVATVCDDLGISYPAGTTSLKVLVDALDRHLLDAHARGRRTVLVIDEAQDLAEDVLEQVRLLTNLETTTAKLLQIILIGQPELAPLLAQPRLRQLAQRITARYHLTPLAREETTAYVRHRLAVAGCPRPVFTSAALRVVHRRSGGVPRLVNVICDRALLGAYTGHQPRVDAATVRRAAAEALGVGHQPLTRPGRTRRVALVAVAAAACIGGILLVGPERLARSLRPEPTGAPIAMVSGDPGRSVGPADGAGSPAAGVPQAPSDSLADWLARTPGPGEQVAALMAVHHRWRPEATVGLDEVRCESGLVGRLGCLAGSGTWYRLRRLNVPAVLELVGPGGERHYAALTGLDAERATVELGGTVRKVDLREVERRWEGRFWILWPRPGLPAFPMAAGARGPDVTWLRRRLDAAEGIAPGGGELYDAALQARVVAFQRSRGLVPDGLIGLDTVTQLAAAVREPGVPWLVPP